MTWMHQRGYEVRDLRVPVARGCGNFNRRAFSVGTSWLWHVVAIWMRISVYTILGRWPTIWLVLLTCWRFMLTLGHFMAVFHGIFDSLLGFATNCWTRILVWHQRWLLVGLGFASVGFGPKAAPCADRDSQAQQIQDVFEKLSQDQGGVAQPGRDGWSVGTGSRSGTRQNQKWGPWLIRLIPCEV